MGTATLKTARLEFKTTPDAKDMLARAAHVGGIDMSALVLGAAMDKARELLEAHDKIFLSLEGQETLSKLLANPPSPTKAMEELMGRPRLPRK